STIGEVPRRVAAAVHYSGDPTDLVSQVQVEANAPAGVVKFTASESSSKAAITLANAFASETRTFIHEQRAQQNAESLDHLRTQKAAIQSRIEELDAEMRASGPAGDPVIEAQRNSAANALQLVLDQMNLLTVGSTQGSGSLDFVQATSAEAQ